MIDHIYENKNNYLKNKWFNYIMNPLIIIDKDTKKNYIIGNKN